MMSSLFCGASGRCACRHQRQIFIAGQAGVGLIEVLVAVLVLSIGFLGIAALQARSLSTNNSAMARNMATVASYSILDAMRADLVSAEGGAYNKTVKGNSCSTTATSLADTQLNQWCSQLAVSLGAAATTSGVISCSNTGDCTVTISFDDSKSGVAGTGSSSGIQTMTIKAML